MSEQMKLSTTQLFKVENKLKVGHIRCSFEHNKLCNQWIPLSKSNDKSSVQLSEIQKVINEIIDRYNTFQKLLAECEKSYKMEINYLTDGLNHSIDLFLSQDNFNYWIRLIPQIGEYNLYIFVYDKEDISDKK